MADGERWYIRGGEILWEELLQHLERPDREKFKTELGEHQAIATIAQHTTDPDTLRKVSEHPIGWAQLLERAWRAVDRETVLKQMKKSGGRPEQAAKVLERWAGAHKETWLEVLKLLGDDQHRHETYHTLVQDLTGTRTKRPGRVTGREGIQLATMARNLQETESRR